MSFLRESDFLGKLEKPPTTTNEHLARPSELFTPYTGRFPHANASSVSVSLSAPTHPGQCVRGEIAPPNREWKWHTHESDALHYAADGFLCKCGSQKNCKGAQYYPVAPNPHRAASPPPQPQPQYMVFGMDSVLDKDKDEEMEEDDIDSKMIDEPTSLLPTGYFGAAPSNKRLNPFF